jgi:hypothetical protein
MDRMQEPLPGRKSSKTDWGVDEMVICEKRQANA